MSAFSELFPTFASVPRRIWGLTLRFGRKVGKPLLIVVAVLFVAHGIATVVLGRKLEAKLAEIKANGGIISLAELGLPEVPDAQNGAVVYSKVFAVLEDEDEGRELNPLDALRRFDKTADDARLDEARRVAERYRWLIPMIEEATSRPQCRFPVAWEKGFRATFPHLSYMRGLERLVTANAVLSAKDGDMDEAARLFELGVEMSGCLEDEPTTIAQLVRWAMLDIVGSGIRTASERGSLGESQARRLSNRLGQIDLRAGHIRAMDGDRALGLWLFDCVRRVGAGGLIGPTGSMTDKALGRLVGSYLWRPFLCADELFYLDYRSRQMEASLSPYREINTRDARLYSEGMPFYAVISKANAPYLLHTAGVRDQAIAKAAGVQAFLGLLAHKDRFGSYPDTLDGLRNRLGWEIPKDPFSGEDFIYRREGNGCLLYSIGMNLRDDGGRVTPHKEALGMEREKVMDDIVWRMDH